MLCLVHVYRGIVRKMERGSSPWPVRTRGNRYKLTEHGLRYDMKEGGEALAQVSQSSHDCPILGTKMDRALSILV